MKSGIYLITCLANQRRYIGSAIDITKRQTEHLRMLRGNYHDNTKFHRAWNKYGEDQFIFSIIEFCSERSLIIREQYYLDGWLGAQDPSQFRIKAFNLTPTAGSQLGFRHSAETKRLLSQQRQGSKHPNYGKNTTEQAKEKMRDKLLGKPRPDISGKRNGMFGRNGVKNPNAKLSQEEYEEILDWLQYWPEVSQVSIAKMYGVSDNHISLIRRGKTWLKLNS